MTHGELQSADATFKLLVWGLVAAGVATYALTRKSSETPMSEVPVAALPPPLPKAILTPIPPLDAGLSSDERVAVQNAVNHETLAANLQGFASTFEPMFPVAASVLRAKAAELQGGITTTGKVEPCCDGCADGLPCDQIVTGPAIFAGLPKSLVR